MSKPFEKTRLRLLSHPHDWLLDEVIGILEGRMGWNKNSKEDLEPYGLRLWRSQRPLNSAHPILIIISISKNLFRVVIGWNECRATSRWAPKSRHPRSLSYIGSNRSSIFLEFLLKVHQPFHQPLVNSAKKMHPGLSRSQHNTWSFDRLEKISKSQRNLIINGWLNAMKKNNGAKMNDSYQNKNWSVAWIPGKSTKRALFFLYLNWA